jgi:hypothetical protein
MIVGSDGNDGDLMLSLTIKRRYGSSAVLKSPRDHAMF